MTAHAQAVNKFRRTARVAGFAAVAALGVSLLAAPVAQAKGDDGVQASGSCSARSDWKLKAKADDGRLEVDFEVDSNAVGQRWAVTMRDNGILIHRRTHQTLAPSGSFSVERRIANRAGSDRITARAKDLATGEVCSGAVTLRG